MHVPNRRQLGIGAATGGALLFVVLLSASAQGAEEFRGKVVGVSDGDTITILRDRRPEKVRLHGIDAPEKGQPFGERAKQFTSSLAFRREVTVRVTGHDRRYGRAVADVVLLDGRSLSRELLRAGYAWWYRQYSTDRSLEDLERQARVARAGLWTDAHPISPWEWRRAKQAMAKP